MSNFGAVNFTGLEPIENTGTTDYMIVDLPPLVSSDVTFSKGGAANRSLFASLTTIESIDFVNPLQSLTVKAGTTGNDTFTIASGINTPTAFTAGFTVGTALLPFATITDNSSLSLSTGTGALDFRAGTIALNGGTITTTSTQN